MLWNGILCCPIVMYHSNVRIVDKRDPCIDERKCITETLLDCLTYKIYAVERILQKISIVDAH